MAVFDIRDLIEALFALQRVAPELAEPLLLIRPLLLVRLLERFGCFIYDLVHDVLLEPALNFILDDLFAGEILVFLETTFLDPCDFFLMGTWLEVLVLQVKNGIDVVLVGSEERSELVNILIEVGDCGLDAFSNTLLVFY